MPAIPASERIGGRAAHPAGGSARQRHRIARRDEVPRRIEDNARRASGERDGSAVGLRIDIVGDDITHRKRVSYVEVGQIDGPIESIFEICTIDDDFAARIVAAVSANTHAGDIRNLVVPKNDIGQRPRIGSHEDAGPIRVWRGVGFPYLIAIRLDITATFDIYSVAMTSFGRV